MMRAWPGEDRRRPGIAHPARLTLRPLSRLIETAVRVDVGGTERSVLDVGCGVQPYRPYFDGVASEYIGVDVEPGEHVDVVAPAAALPFPEARFDVVLCTQTLEHVPDPAAALREFHRVLKPGGVLLLSTHGTAVYHPGPSDLWRWTQEGLPKLVRENGSWSELRLEAAGGTAACFGYLVGFYVAAALGHRLLAPFRYVLVAFVNLFFGALDGAVDLRPPRRHTLISNFLVVARKG